VKDDDRDRGRGGLTLNLTTSLASCRGLHPGTCHRVPSYCHLGEARGGCWSLAHHGGTGMVPDMNVHEGWSVKVRVLVWGSCRGQSSLHTGEDPRHPGTYEMTAYYHGGLTLVILVLRLGRLGVVHHRWGLCRLAPRPRRNPAAGAYVGPPHIPIKGLGASSRVEGCPPTRPLHTRPTAEWDGSFAGRHCGIAWGRTKGTGLQGPPTPSRGPPSSPPSSLLLCPGRVQAACLRRDRNFSGDGS